MNIIENLNVIGLSALLMISLTLYKINAKKNYRIIILICSLGFLGFYLKGYLCPIGAFQNIVLLNSMIFNVDNLSTIILFFLPIIFIFLGGRIFCGSVCPMGALQELLFMAGTKIGLNKGGSGKKIPSVLKYFKYFFMAGIISFTAIAGVPVFCGFDPYQTLFSFSGTAFSVFLLILVVVTSLIISRFWCRVVCPYGALLSVINTLYKKIAVKTGIPVIDTVTCKSCSLCSKECPANAICNNKINVSECISCGKCKNICRFESCK